MAWIRQIDESQAEGPLRQIYASLIKQRGKVANIMRVQSLDPTSIEAHMALYLHLMFGSHNLGRREREMIAVSVSATNSCAYCVRHHTEALRHYEHDVAVLEALAAGYRRADLAPPLCAMLAYVVKLTRTPSAVTEEDVRELREAGFADEEILRINLIAAYFNFVNRVALGLGVEFNDDEVFGYKV